MYRKSNMKKIRAYVYCKSCLEIVQKISRLCDKFSKEYIKILGENISLNFNSNGTKVNRREETCSLILLLWSRN